MAMATNSPRIFGFKVIVVISCVYIVLGFPSPAASNSLPSSQLSQSSSGSAGNGAGSKKIHLVSPTMNKMYRLMKYGSNSGTDDEDWFLDEDNQLQKRQYDDYGHMRFGKRQNDFDDYGHLRFGK